MFRKQSFNLNSTHFIHNSITGQHPLLFLSTPSLSVAVLYRISSLLQEILFSFWQVSRLCLKENLCLWLHLLPFCLQLPQTRQGKMMPSIWCSHHSILLQEELPAWCVMVSISVINPCKRPLEGTNKLCGFDFQTNVVVTILRRKHFLLTLLKFFLVTLLKLWLYIT